MLFPLVSLGIQFFLVATALLLVAKELRAQERDAADQEHFRRKYSSGPV